MFCVGFVFVGVVIDDDKVFYKVITFCKNQNRKIDIMDIILDDGIKPILPLYRFSPPTSSTQSYKVLTIIQKCCCWSCGEGWCCFYKLSFLQKKPHE